jgi:DNA-binding response OmpR family regulator
MRDVHHPVTVPLLLTLLSEWRDVVANMGATAPSHRIRSRTPPRLGVLRTVVIADDESSLRLLVHATIESDNYNVIEAQDGETAWELIKQVKPTLVLLDVHMPGRSGLEVLRLIRANPNLKGTRVILLTSKVQKEDFDAGLLAGADFYLTKPFSPMELLTCVEEALALR